MTIQTFHLSHPKYRPDIDGLRALAVIAVIAYHAFPDLIRGGFIGVDIFFVISGYLISLILFKNLDGSTFSFYEFYARRVRRIFPALLVVLISCYVFGWFALLADEFKQLGKHIISGATFVSNFILWNEAGYFDNSADSKPLLHLWSLGIEEQFYIVWPILLWLAWKRSFNLLTITFVIAIISFALNLDGVKQNPLATFYSPLTRVWELLAGSVLAWLTLFKTRYFSEIKSKINRGIIAAVYSDERKVDEMLFPNMLSFAGFFLLIYGIWRINRELSFPGGWALVPVFGTLMIIAAGPSAWANRLFFSNRLAVWVGLISYPLYLWHWPLLSFARIIESGSPAPKIKLMVIALAFLFSWLTYILIELPVRKSWHGKTRMTILVVSMMVVGFLGYNVYSRDGMLFRFNRLSDENRIAAKKIAEAWQFSSYPTPEQSFNDPKYGLLRVGSNSNYVILFVGDSHVGQYWNSVPAFISSSNINPAPSVLFFPTTFPPKIDSKLVDDPGIKVVVFSYFWAFQYGSDKINYAVRCCAIGELRPIGPHNFVTRDSAAMDEMDKKLVELVQRLAIKGKKVYFILDNPFGEEIDPHSMLKRSWNGFHLANHSILTKSHAEIRSEPVRSRIIEIAIKNNATIIDPIPFLCPNDICSPFSSEGDLLYKDYDHLSLYSSKNKAEYLRSIFNY